MTELLSPNTSFFRFNSPEHQLEANIAYHEFLPPDNNYDKTLFCAHGLTHNGRVFDYLASSAALNHNYRVIALDYPGRGQSDWLPHAGYYNYGTYCLVINQLLQHLGITSVDWVGTSMGGLTAMFYANLYRGQIRKLIMNDIGPFLSAACLEAIFNYTAQVPEFDDIETAISTLKANFTGSNITNDNHFKHLSQHFLITTADNKYSFHYDPSAVIGAFPDGGKSFADIDLWSSWPAVSMPTLLLRGADSIVLTAATAEQMLTTHQSRNLKLITYPNTGHCPNLMDQDQIQTVLTWLTS